MEYVTRHNDIYWYVIYEALSLKTLHSPKLRILFLKSWSIGTIWQLAGHMAHMRSIFFSSKTSLELEHVLYIDDFPLKSIARLWGWSFWGILRCSRYPISTVKVGFPWLNLPTISCTRETEFSTDGFPGVPCSGPTPSWVKGFHELPTVQPPGKPR